MTMKQDCQLTQQLKTMQNILDIEIKICQLLHIQSTDFKQQPIHFNLTGLNIFKTILKKIYNKLLAESSPIKKVDQYDDKSDIFETNQEKQAYEKIQDLLQKEQSKNRTLLRKQFQFKEYQNSMIDQLNEQKENNRNLNQKINKLTQQLQQKTLQIMHLRNQTKAYQRGHKDYLMPQKSQILNKNTYYQSFVYAQMGNQSSKNQKKIATSRQKQYNRLNPKKSKDLRQKTLYALYNNHKKNHSQTINMNGNTEKVKRGATSQKNTAKKNLLKDLNSIDFSNNKKVIHSRRKSQQFYKKTPSQKQGRQSKQNKKKKDQVIQKIIF